MAFLPEKKTSDHRVAMAHTGTGGPLLTADSADSAPADRKFYGSCLVLEAENLEAARKLIENDIYYTSGVVSVLCLVQTRTFLTVA